MSFVLFVLARARNKKPGKEGYEMSEWLLVKATGNYWRHVKDDEGVTVFRTSDDTWKWVYDGDFDDTEYGSDVDAMSAAEFALDLE